MLSDEDYELEVNRIERETVVLKVISGIICGVFAFLAVALIFIWGWKLLEKLKISPHKNL